MSGPYRAAYLLSVCFFLLRGHLCQCLLHRAAQVVGNAELGLTDSVLDALGVAGAVRLDDRLGGTQQRRAADLPDRP